MHERSWTLVQYQPKIEMPASSIESNKDQDIKKIRIMRML